MNDIVAQDAIDDGVMDFGKGRELLADAIREKQDGVIDTVSEWAPTSTTISVDALPDATVVIRWLDEFGVILYEQAIAFDAEKVAK